MRVSRLKKALQAGESIIAAGPGFSSPELVEFLGYLAFDCIFIDAEHGPIGLKEAQEMVRAADAVGIPTLTRVPQNDPATILGYLETGTEGILVPHVNDAAAAQAAVGAAKYPPVGIRGAHSGTRAANYGMTQTSAEYFARADQETLVSVMIEEYTAIENLDEILQVEGQDLFMLGPGDLSMSMGFPGQPFHPEVQENVKLALKKILAAGKSAGTVAGNGEQARQLIEKGFQCILVSMTGLLAPVVRQFLTQARTRE
jgi:4-hydroxy-2-oxoheptanedioate aldolase